MYKFIDPVNPTKVLGGSNDFQFMKVLQSKWDALHDETTIFRYKINNLPEKFIDGYLLQLNTNRNTKRRTPEQFESICQPFDSNKFNFTKASPNEFLFNFTREENDSDLHTILVNVSPISRYHSLLCPSISKCLPQIVTEESIVVALDIMLLANDRDLRIGFNSLCALASVNHLHYHLCLEKNSLPVEYAKCKHLQGSVYCLENCPVPAFCFEVLPHSIAEISKDIFKLLSYLLENSIAHNIFITRGQRVQPTDNKEVVRVLVWPRKSMNGAKQLAVFNVALLELSGWFPIYTKEDYERLNKDDLENELRKWKVNNFERLCEEVKLLF